MSGLIFLAQFVWLLLIPSNVAAAIKLHPGFIYKFKCEGRLLVSAVGNDSLLRIEALPKESGCAVLVKPKATRGITNIYLETSSGTVTRVLEVSPGEAKNLPHPPLGFERRVLFPG